MCVEINTSHYAFILAKNFIIGIQYEEEVALDHWPQSGSLTVNLQLISEELQLMANGSDWPAGSRLVLGKLKCRCQSSQLE